MNVLGFSGLNDSVRFKRHEFPHLDERCYRIAQGFDAAAALVDGRGVRAAVAEERFTREKTTGAFPVNALSYCLRSAGLDAADVGALAHGFDYAPYREHFDVSDYARRQYSEVYAREVQAAHVKEHFPGSGLEERLVHVPHHLAHAASTFYLSGMDEALVLVCDGMGEQQSTTVALGRGADIEILTQIPSIHSLGILYSVFTLYLGFVFNMDEYKVMGLAPYGDPRRYAAAVRELVTLHPDGGHTIPLLFRNESEHDKETYEGSLAVLTELFGPRREPEAEITQHHQDLAAALQVTLEGALRHLLQHHRNETGQRALCMAGGVALNCTANGVLQRSRLFRDIFIQPAAGDDGSALGAALWAQRQQDRDCSHQRMGLPLWGPEFDEDAIAAAVAEADDLEVTLHADEAALVADAADRIAQGQIIGWFQGRMEFGPRALGSRSILADPRRADMRDRVNALVKKREGFRPFAPAVAAEAASTYFNVNAGDESQFAHMLFVTPVRREHRESLPAITHVDGTARVQSVDATEHPRFHALLAAFESRSGVPVVLNTSFNVRGQPIVCTPQEAIETFRFARLDALVIGDRVLELPAAR